MIGEIISATFQSQIIILAIDVIHGRGPSNQIHPHINSVIQY